MALLTAYLILGHLLGDFVFQPSKLVVWKNRSIAGLSVHILIHLTINFLILLPLIFQNPWIITLVLTIYATHFLIDHAKISYESKTKPKNNLPPFLIDQILHFLVIAIAIIAATKSNYTIQTADIHLYYTMLETPIFLSLLIVATNGLTIYQYESARTKTKVNFLSEQNLTRATILLAIFYLYLSS